MKNFLIVKTKVDLITFIGLPFIGIRSFFQDFMTKKLITSSAVNSSFHTTAILHNISSKINHITPTLTN